MSGHSRGGGKAGERKPNALGHCGHGRPPTAGVPVSGGGTGAGTERGAAAVGGEVKSGRGRPKTYDSDGQACMEPGCEYYKDTDATYHALRRDGQRNQCEATPQWECGACGSKHTARLGTPLYGLKTSSERVRMAVHLSVLGLNGTAVMLNSPSSPP